MFFVLKFHNAVCSGLGTYMKYCTLKSGVEDDLEVKLRISISKVFDSTHASVRKNILKNIFFENIYILSNEKLIDFYFKKANYILEETIIYKPLVT